MGLTIALIFGLILGLVLMFIFMQRKMKEITAFIPAETEDEKQKKENLAKIEAYIADKDKFTNDDLEDYLGVSNTTIGRYLDELEEQGRIQQVGKTGRWVYYEKIS